MQGKKPYQIGHPLEHKGLRVVYRRREAIFMRVMHSMRKGLHGMGTA